MVNIRLALLFGLLSLLHPGSVTRGDSAPPNILLIVADDLGFSDLGSYGGEISTPNLDAVAGGGLRFTQFYNTARCWPTRAALLTGYYAQQVRRDALPDVPSGGRGVRPAWAVLLPALLESAGYRSYHTGKWHIDGMPLENGFDRSYYLRDQGRFFNPTRHWQDDVALPPIDKGTGFYATTALADHAIEVLQEHAREHADAPFFHYLAFSAPHFPLHALPEDIALYRDLYKVGWDSIRRQRWQRLNQLGLFADDSSRQLSRVERDLGPPYHFPEALQTLGAGEVNRPLPWDQLNEEQQQFQATKMAIHAAMIHRMDREIGRVFDQLKQMGRWDNTIVLFLSDNGASAEIMVRDDGHDPSLPPGSAGTYLCLGPGWSTTCNTPFRRHKTWTHEGGVSTPLIVAWPNGISGRGALRRTPGHVIDIAVTLLELAGVESPADTPPKPGQSLVSLFSEDRPNQRDPLWWFHDGHKAIRDGDWKAVAPIGEPWELYNLAQDRDESTDLAIPHWARLQRLIKRWEDQLASFSELASRDLPEAVLAKARGKRNRPGAMSRAQDAARPQRRQVLLEGQSFLLMGRHAFVMSPRKAAGQDGKPWIFYAPTLPTSPDKAESWMHEQFLEAGVAVAGIDVGEAYGSPHAFPFFEALRAHMIQQGYAEKPALLGRSRGGLWVSSWALRDPDRVAGIGGIYPVYDYISYPGPRRAAPAYGRLEQELIAQQEQLNPVKQAGRLAQAKLPICIIHGTDDRVVPLQANSGAFAQAYEKHGADRLLKLIKVPGQGHNYWPGFFRCQELVDFMIEQANRGAGKQ